MVVGQGIPEIEGGNHISLAISGFSSTCWRAQEALCQYVDDEQSPLGFLALGAVRAWFPLTPLDTEPYVTSVSG